MRHSRKLATHARMHARTHARTHRLSPSFFNPSPYKLNAQKTPLPVSGAFCAFLRLQKNSAPASAAKSPPPSPKYTQIQKTI